MPHRRIFHNTFFSVVGHGIGDASGLLFLVIFARYFGSDVLGEFWYAMAVGAILGALITRRTSKIILRDVSQNLEKAAKYIGVASSLELIIAFGILVLLVVLSSTITDTARARSILIIVGLYQIVYVLASIFRTYFNATEKMQYNALLEGGHKIMILICGVVALFLFTNPAIVLLVYPLAALTIYVVGYVLVTRQFERPTLHMDWRLNWQWTVAALPMFMYGMLTVLANRSGVIALGQATDTATVGIFAVGDRLISAFCMPYIMFTGAVFPVMSKLAHSPLELRHFTQNCLRVTTVAAVPLVGLIILFQEPIVVLVFGEQYTASATILGILALGLACAAMNSMLSMLLVATNQLWSLFRIYAVSLIVLFVGIFVTINTLGPVGLAWSVVASKATASLGLLFYVGRGALDIAIFRAMSGAVAAAIAMTLAFFTLSSFGEATRDVLTIVAGIIALVLFRGVEPGDFKRLREIVEK